VSVARSLSLKLSKVLSAENAEGAENQDNILFLARRTYVFSAHISAFSAPSALIVENVGQNSTLRSLLKMLDNSIIVRLLPRKYTEICGFSFYGLWAKMFVEHQEEFGKNAVKA
jgi:hypothetical protein